MIKIPRVVTLLGIFLAQNISGIGAQALSCAEDKRTITEIVGASDATYTATAVSRDAAKVTEVIKGAAAAEELISIVTDKTWGPNIEAGYTYLMFLKLGDGGSYATDLCSTTYVRNDDPSFTDSIEEARKTTVKPPIQTTQKPIVTTNSYNLLPALLPALLTPAIALLLLSNKARKRRKSKRS